MPFTFRPLAIPEVVCVEPTAYTDERGSFTETFRGSEFAAAGIPGPFVQDDLSRSRRGVLRGLHFQRPPHAQGRLVGVVRGEIFDVAVDLRRGSPTYGRWVSAHLSEENRRLLWVPPGFAHGFCALAEVNDVTYKMTAEYAPAAEGGVLWSDPALGIPWPMAAPILSARDARWPGLAAAHPGF